MVDCCWSVVWVSLFTTSSSSSIRVSYWDLYLSLSRAICLISASLRFLRVSVSAVNLLTVSCSVKFSDEIAFWCLFSWAIVASLKAWRSLLFCLSFSSSWRCTSANSSLKFALRTRIVSAFWEEIVSKSYLCFAWRSRRVSECDTLIYSKSYLYFESS